MIPGGLSYLLDGDGQVLLDGDNQPLVETLPPPAAPTRIAAIRPIAGQSPLPPSDPGAALRIADAMSGEARRDDLP